MTEPPQNAEPPKDPEASPAPEASHTPGASPEPEAPQDAEPSAKDDPGASAQPATEASAQPEAGPSEQGWQAPDAPSGGERPAVPAPAEPVDDRPPPYQGVYGAPPGARQPAFAPPGGQAPPPGSGQAGYGQPPYGQAPPGYGQPPYGQPPHPQAPYGQAPYGQAPYGQAPYGQAPYGQAPYGPPGFAPTQTNVLAPRGLRFVAAILDQFIIGIFNTPVVLLSIRWDRMRDIGETGRPLDNPLDIYNIPRLVAGTIVVMLLGFAYYTVQHAKWGQTLGKRAVGIRVVRAADHTAASWGQIVARQGFVYLAGAITTALTFLVPFGGLFGFITLLDDAWILWDRDRQAVHDMVGGTVVVRAPVWAPNPYARDS